jgi:predicted permease
MRAWSRLASFWRTLMRGRRLDANLDDELQTYLDEIIRRKIAAGLDPATARRQALIEMGGLDQVKEGVRDARIGRLADDTLRDVSYAWRTLRKSPGFTLAAVATLALGVGATAAIFSVVNALLIAPLPYADPSRLVFVWADQTAEGYPRAPLSGPELIDLDTRTSRFEGFGGIWSTTAALTDRDEPEQLRVGHVTPDFFSLLGANAALGRTFVDADVATGPPTAILLSDALFKRRYGGDPGIVGSRVLVNGNAATVIGVMPESFRLLMPPDASVPDDLDAFILFDSRRIPQAPRGQRFLRVIGRLREDATIADANADIARIGAEISKAFVEYGAAGRTFDMIPLQADAVREIRGPLLAVFGGVAILLAIACVNVTSLLIARAAARSKETAMRIALGAGYGRLLRQHLIEGLLLTAIGAVAGIAAGRLALDGLLALTPPSLSRLSAARIDMTVFAFSLGIMLAWGLILSLAPLSEVMRVKLATAIRIDAARSGSSSGGRLRSMLITAQIALSVVLVVGALLLVRTFIKVQHADVGFNGDGIFSFRLAARAASRDQALAFARQLQASLAALPGVIGAASISHAPYDHVPNWGGPYLWEAGADPSTAPQADYRSLSPGALELLGIRLIEGRGFTEDDDLRSQPVLIVDSRVVARAWPGQSAVGRRLCVDGFVSGKPNQCATVVGVVEHVRHRNPVEEVRDQVYFPQRQIGRNPSVYLVKSAGDTVTLVPAIREALRKIDPALPIYDARPLSVYIEEARATRAFTMQLAGIFAIVALILASVGIYGVIAYSVALRHREFGVRQALGASSLTVMALVAREGTRLVMRGVATGILLAAVAAWLLRGLLFGVSPWDPITFAAAIPPLLLAGAVACLVPARRATAASPVDALRSE